MDARHVASVCATDAHTNGISLIRRIEMNLQRTLSKIMKRTKRRLNFFRFQIETKCMKNFKISKKVRKKSYMRY